MSDRSTKQADERTRAFQCDQLIGNRNDCGSCRSCLRWNVFELNQLIADRDAQIEALEQEAMRGRPAFLTGSRAYGKSTAESDIDIVMMVSEQTRSDLFYMARSNGSTGSIYLDNVNIIALCDPRQYDAWWAGTQTLCTRQEKASRDEAVEVMKVSGVLSTEYCDGLRTARKAAQ